METLKTRKRHSRLFSAASDRNFETRRLRKKTSRESLSVVEPRKKAARFFDDDLSNDTVMTRGTFQCLSEEEELRAFVSFDRRSKVKRLRRLSRDHTSQVQTRFRGDFS